MTPAEQQRYQEMLQQAAINDPQARMHAASFIKTTTGKNLRDLSPSTLAPLMAAFFQMSPTIQGLTGAPQSPYGYAAPYVAAMNGLASRGTVNVLSRGANGALVSNNVLANSHTVQDATTGFVAQMLKPYGDTHGVLPYNGISSSAAGSLVGMYMRENGVSMHQQQADSSASGLRAQLENLRNSDNGIVKGGIEDKRLTRLADARENLDIAAILREKEKKGYIRTVIDGKKVKKDLADYKGKDDVERARAMLRDLQSQGAEVDFYNKLNENEKRVVANTMRDNIKLSTTESGDRISDTEISQAQHIAEGKGVLTHIGKETEEAAAAAAKRASSVIKKFSGIFGTDDPNSIQAALREIKVGSILTEKGVEEAHTHLRETKVLAARTGQDVAEIMKAQVNVARMMSPHTKAETIRDITEFSMRTAQSHANNPDSYENTRYTAEEQQAVYMRARANEQNHAKGVGFARLAISRGLVYGENKDKLEAKLAEWKQETDPDKKARISDELTAMAHDMGVNTENAKVQEESASLITQKEVKANIKNKMLEEIDNKFNQYADSTWVKTAASVLGGDDAARAAAKDVLSFTAGDKRGYEIIKDIAEGKLSDAEMESKYGGGTGKKTQELRSTYTAEQLQAVQALFGTLRNFKTIDDAHISSQGDLQQALQTQAEEAQRTAEMDTYRRNGEALDKDGAIEAFTKGLLGGETVTGTAAREMLFKTNAAAASKLMPKTDGNLALAIAGAIGDGSFQSAAANYFFADEDNQKALQRYLSDNKIDRKNISDPKKYREAYWGAMQTVMKSKGFSTEAWLNEVKEGSLSLSKNKDGTIDAADDTWNRITKTLGLKSVDEAKNMGWDKLITALSAVEGGKYGDPMLAKGKDGAEQAVFMTDKVTGDLVKASHHKVNTRYKNLDKNFKENLKFDGAGNVTHYIDKNGDVHDLSSAKKDDKTGEYIIQDAEGKQELRIAEDAKTGAQSWKVVEAAKESKTKEEQEKEEEKKKEEEDREARAESRSLLKNVANMIDEFLSGSKVPKVKVENTEDFKK